MQYLGRIHYCAADDSTAEPAAGAGMNGAVEGAWGEHEIDYILFIKATVDLVPNPEEVRYQLYLRLSVILEFHPPFASLSLPLPVLP
jgi:isopentenyldiphosphate isomerase